MLRLKRHIVTEIIGVFLAVVVALILIITSFQFAKLLAEATAGKIVGDAIYNLLFLKAINLFVLLTPFAFFIAVLISLSKLATDNELIAMKSVGYSDIKTYEAIFLFAIPLAGIILWLTLFILPDILTLNYQLKQKAKEESKLSIIQPGNFRTIGGNTTVFVADVDDNTFSKFFVWQRLPGSESVTAAVNGRQYTKDRDRFIELYNGSRYSVADDKTSSMMIFERFEVLMPEIKPPSRIMRLKAIPTSELMNNPTTAYRIEIQRRISPAISILLLALFAPLLVQFNPRENRYGKFAIAILIYALYANSQYIFQAMIYNQWLPIVPGIYSAHIIFLAIIILWMGWRHAANKADGD